MLGIHDLMVHDYGPGSKLVSFHIELSADSDVMKSHDLIDSIERDFQVHDHLLVTIHFDPVVTDDPHINELRKFLKEQLAEIAPEADIHDLRIVPGPTHTNVIFVLCCARRLAGRQGPPRQQNPGCFAQSGIGPLAGPFLRDPAGTDLCKTEIKTKVRGLLQWIVAAVLLNMAGIGKR
mgnify:CR=1 FL=1